jgi:GT2 family glycosyltransferase
MVGAESCTGRPAVAVSILNYNSAAYTRTAVASILEKTDPALDFRIVVVENGSRLSEQVHPKEWADARVQVVTSRINLGFAGGHQFALQFARARYYFLFNNDGYFVNDVLQGLFHFMETHPDVGLATGRCLGPDGQPRPSFDYLPSLLRAMVGSGILRWIHPGRYPDRRASYTQPLDVPMVTGSALFVRGGLLESLGGLDTRFFLYCEEEDLARRVRSAGQRICYVPDVCFCHVGCGSMPMQLALRKEFYLSFLYYLRKHHGPLVTLGFRGFLLAKLFARALRRKDPWALWGFLVRGAPERESLRFRQRMT